jgi:hypothetical protein
MRTLPEQPDGNIPLLYTAFFKKHQFKPIKNKNIEPASNDWAIALYDRRTRPVGVSPILPT